MATFKVRATKGGKTREFKVAAKNLRTAHAIARKKAGESGHSVKSVGFYTKEDLLARLRAMSEGGSGSGNFGHSGRAGEVGGSGDGAVVFDIGSVEKTSSAAVGKMSDKELATTFRATSKAFDILQKKTDSKDPNYINMKSNLELLGKEMTDRANLNSKDKIIHKFGTFWRVPLDTEESIINRLRKLSEGGAGSGNFGHSGRPGEQGGSGSGGGDKAVFGWSPTAVIRRLSGGGSGGSGGGGRPGDRGQRAYMQAAVRSHERDTQRFFARLKASDKAKSQKRLAIQAKRVGARPDNKSVGRAVRQRIAGRKYPGVSYDHLKSAQPSTRFGRAITKGINQGELGTNAHLPGSGWKRGLRSENILARMRKVYEGGAGSGNFGHSGRAGEVGGSGEGGERGSYQMKTPTSGGKFKSYKWGGAGGGGGRGTGSIGGSGGRIFKGVGTPPPHTAAWRKILKANVKSGERSSQARTNASNRAAKKAGWDPKRPYDVSYLDKQRKSFGATAPSIAARTLAKAKEQSWRRTHAKKENIMVHLRKVTKVERNKGEA